MALSPSVHPTQLKHRFLPGTTNNQWKMKKLLLISILAVIYWTDGARSSPVWGYQCVDDRCARTAITEDNIDSLVGLAVCRLNCSEPFGTLWPRPNGQFRVGHDLVTIDLDQVWFEFYTQPAELIRYWVPSFDRFKNQLKNKLGGEELAEGGSYFLVDVAVEQNSMVLNHETKEYYKLAIFESEGIVLATIEADNYFGARHALETLAQLIVYDEVRGVLQVMLDVEIEDEPVFPHRGTHLDTVRHYIDVDSIKRNIDALAMVKMNVFHWHITDSQSWPLVIESHPVLHTYGAYSPKKIFTAEQVEDIVEFALTRGVRIIPEFDAPGHIGEGWEQTGLVSCFNFQPWIEFCYEPPCGQFDPTKEQLYDMLEDVYAEMNAMFSHSDLFHMGGDEVILNCWNSSSDIQEWMLDQGWNLEEEDFMKLWNHFQTNALARLEKSLQNNQTIILWTSTLTEEPYDQYLDPDRYIVQAWGAAGDPIVPELLQKGFRLIISNYDTLYLDCGFPGWVEGGHNWCSPYSGWQEIYDNDIEAMGGNYSAGIIGGETALWTEQADQFTVDSRLWPRVSAFAERLWSNPSEGWRAAEARILMHRVRLVENGIGAETLQPTWCVQHEGICPLA